MKIALNKDNLEEQIFEFRAIAEKITAVATKYSLSIKPFHSPDLPLYSALPEQKRAEALQQIKIFLNIMEGAEASHRRLDDDERFTWFALSSLDLIPPPDLFAKIKPGTVIEIYDLNSFQIWRNFGFFKYCSYTLEEIYCVEWFHRYKRSEESLQMCLKYLEGILSGQLPDIAPMEIPLYSMEETSSEGRLCIRMDHGIICRLKNRQGEAVAYLVTADGEILSKGQVSDKASLSLIKS